MTMTSAKMTTKLSPVEIKRAAPQVSVAMPTPDEANPIYQATMAPGVNSAERTAAFVKTMLNSVTITEQRARIKEFSKHREWLSNVSKAMDVQAIQNEDQQTMSRVQKIINEMGSQLSRVDEVLTPMIEDVDAFYAVTKNGDLYGVFERQEKAEAELDALEKNRHDIESRVASIKSDIKYLTSTNMRLAEDTTFFTGRVKGPSQSKIDGNLQTITNLQMELQNDLATKLEELNKRRDELKTARSPEEERFYKMLQMAPEELDAQEAKAKEETVKFITVSDTQLSSLRQDFDAMTDRKNLIQDNTQRLVEVYGTLTEGLKTTIDALKVKRAALLAKPDNETQPEEAIRKDKIANLDEYIGDLTTAQVSTNAGYADLTIDANEVRASKEKFKRIMSLAESIQVDGVKKSAAGLRTSIHALNQAKIENAAIGAQQIIASLGKVTDNISQKEWMQLSERTSAIKKSLEATMSRSQEFNEVWGQGIEVARENFQGIQDLLVDLNKTITTSKERGKEFDGLAAESDRPKAPGQSKASDDKVYRI